MVSFETFSRPDKIDPNSLETVETTSLMLLKRSINIISMSHDCTRKKLQICDRGILIMALFPTFLGLKNWLAKLHKIELVTSINKDYSLFPVITNKKRKETLMLKTSLLIKRQYKQALLRISHY